MFKKLFFFPKDFLNTFNCGYLKQLFSSYKKIENTQKNFVLLKNSENFFQNKTFTNAQLEAHERSSVSTKSKIIEIAKSILQVCLHH